MDFSCKPENMNDTNKLLWLILQELKENKGNCSKKKAKRVTEPIKAQSNDVAHEGHKCKYCGEFIPGNRGNFLAHCRKCEQNPNIR